MVTIAGTLLDASGSAWSSCPIDFTLTTAPHDSSSNFVGGRTIREVTGTGGSAGAYSLSLAPGLYRVRIPTTKESFITVPAGSGTFTLSDLAIVTEGETMAGGWPVYESYTDVALDSIPSNELIAVDSDYNGRPGFFRRNDAYVVITEGADGVTDSGGRVFKRQTYE